MLVNSAMPSCCTQSTVGGIQYSSLALNFKMILVLLLVDTGMYMYSLHAYSILLDILRTLKQEVQFDVC